ncbi:MAG: metal-binding protein [Pyrinomonadaceae bacterium]
MPSGRTHDLVTVALAPPTFAAALVLTGSITMAVIVTVFMLFGGLMFGPDLDTLSRQYTRWGWFRVLWYPYRVVFRHRSRWSHGLTVGTLIRVLYFSGVIALVV